MPDEIRRGQPRLNSDRLNRRLNSSIPPPAVFSVNTDKIIKFFRLLIRGGKKRIRSRCEFGDSILVKVIAGQA